LPISPATQEAQAGGWLELRSWGPVWATYEILSERKERKKGSKKEKKEILLKINKRKKNFLCRVEFLYSVWSYQYMTYILNCSIIFVKTAESC
jgi:hypothetical protein